MEKACEEGSSLASASPVGAAAEVVSVLIGGAFGLDDQNAGIIKENVFREDLD